jgi:hypothetical protein
MRCRRSVLVAGGCALVTVIGITWARVRLLGLPVLPALLGGHPAATAGPLTR